MIQIQSLALSAILFYFCFLVTSGESVQDFNFLVGKPIDLKICDDGEISFIKPELPLFLHYYKDRIRGTAEKMENNRFTITCENRGVFQPHEIIIYVYSAISKCDFDYYSSNNNNTVYKSDYIGDVINYEIINSPTPFGIKLDIKEGIVQIPINITNTKITIKCSNPVSFLITNIIKSPSTRNLQAVCNFVAPGATFSNYHRFKTFLYAISHTKGALTLNGDNIGGPVKDTNTGTIVGYTVETLDRVPDNTGGYYSRELTLTVPIAGLCKYACRSAARASVSSNLIPGLMVYLFAEEGICVYNQASFNTAGYPLAAKPINNTSIYTGGQLMELFENMYDPLLENGYKFKMHGYLDKVDVATSPKLSLRCDGCSAKIEWYYKNIDTGTADTASGSSPSRNCDSREDISVTIAIPAATYLGFTIYYSVTRNSTYFPFEFKVENYPLPQIYHPQLTLMEFDHYNLVLRKNIPMKPMNILYRYPTLPFPASFPVFNELPAGLRFDTATGVISGTPTTVTSGTFGYSFLFGAYSNLKLLNNNQITSFGIKVIESDYTPLFFYVYKSEYKFLVNERILIRSSAAYLDGVTFKLISDPLDKRLTFNKETGEVTGIISEAFECNMTIEYTYRMTYTNSMRLSVISK